MDGLSAGAGAIAILQAIGAIPTIIDTLRTLIHNGDEIKALTNELTTLQALQDHLKSQVDLLSGTDPRLRVPEPKMMQLARATLAELIDELHRLVTKYNNKKRRRMLFVWDRNKIAQMGERRL
jgi:molybdopterin converting factor small subunit